MNTDQYAYEDLILVETFVRLQRALDDFATANPKATVMDKYLHLCALQWHSPSPAYMDFLQHCCREEGRETSVPPAEDDRRQAGRQTANPTEGCLSFRSEYMGSTLLLPVIATLPECGSHLVSLDLSDCHLSSVMVQLCCCKALAHNGRLRSLDVSANPCCGSLAVEALLQLVLRQTNICTCNIRGLSSISPLNRRLEEALQRNRAAAPRVVEHM